ncbi:hypothetical protein [Methyloceanibacter marginalis]|uniref:hypothetical protein n=1 Tax=Methyloceanibacter marginalis TaxID=1774971 RepID=UPI000AACFEF3|nr:hypothetical protein [Methyloceanibacter marginalis]
MGTCAQCGNDYDKSFDITMDGRTATFDSFECAIAAMAPTCPKCMVRIVGTVWNTATQSIAAPIARRWTA